jgi:hypothetical protein
MFSQNPADTPVIVSICCTKGGYNPATQNPLWQTNTSSSVQNSNICSVWYRQLNDKVWEVVWSVYFGKTYNVTCIWDPGVGQYLFNLPSEVPDIALTGVPYIGSSVTQTTCKDVQGRDWELLKIVSPAILTGGSVYRGGSGDDVYYQTPNASIYSNRAIRFLAAAPYQPGVIGEGWFEPFNSGSAVSTWRFSGRFQAV